MLLRFTNTRVTPLYLFRCSAPVSTVTCVPSVGKAPIVSAFSTGPSWIWFLRGNPLSRLGNIPPDTLPVLGLKPVRLEADGDPPNKGRKTSSPLQGRGCV